MKNHELDAPAGAPRRRDGAETTAPPPLKPPPPVATRQGTSMNSRIVATSFLALVLAAPVCAQEMAAPTLVVGDRWSYRETDLLTKVEVAQITETVTAANATEFWVDARRASRTWWRGDAVKRAYREQFAYSEGAADQRGKVIASSDGGCAYPWPLKAGTTFECVDKTTWPNGWSVRYELKYTVEGAETIETPAGKFETLRVVAKGYANNETVGTISRNERTVWLAPAVKREVKHEIRTFLKNGQLFKVEGRELVAFTAGGG
jgi:Protein of unknown function (DUF3108)